jgi:hypothetical protein
VRYRRIGIAVVVAVVAACPGRSRTAPPPDVDRNVQLHVEHAIGVPVVDIRREPDAGSTRIQIGGASVHLPTREPDPPPME